MMRRKTGHDRASGSALDARLTLETSNGFGQRLQARPFDVASAHRACSIRPIGQALERRCEPVDPIRQPLARHEAQVLTLARLRLIALVAGMVTPRPRLTAGGVRRSPEVS